MRVEYIAKNNQQDSRLLIRSLSICLQDGDSPSSSRTLSQLSLWMQLSKVVSHYDHIWASRATLESQRGLIMAPWTGRGIFNFWEALLLHFPVLQIWVSFVCFVILHFLGAEVGRNEIFGGFRKFKYLNFLIWLFGIFLIWLLIWIFWGIFVVFF